jgi:hypothetical protein
MLNERLKSSLKKDRAMTSITLRIPVDVVESMQAIAPQRGFTGYQPLLKPTSAKVCAAMRCSLQLHRKRN